MCHQTVVRCVQRDCRGRRPRGRALGRGGVAFDSRFDGGRYEGRCPYSIENRRLALQDAGQPCGWESHVRQRADLNPVSLRQRRRARQPRHDADAGAIVDSSERLELVSQRDRMIPRCIQGSATVPGRCCQGVRCGMAKSAPTSPASTCARPNERGSGLLPAPLREARVVGQLERKPVRRPWRHADRGPRGPASEAGAGAQRRRGRCGTPRRRPASALQMLSARTAQRGGAQPAA